MQDDVILKVGGGRVAVFLQSARHIVAPVDSAQ